MLVCWAFYKYAGSLLASPCFIALSAFLDVFVLLSVVFCFTLLFYGGAGWHSLCIMIMMVVVVLLIICFLGLIK